MQLVDRRLFPGAALPVVVVPLERRRVDHLARAVDVARLEARGGIGNEQLAVDAVLVERSRAGLRIDDLEPTVGLRLHLYGFGFDLCFDFPCRGRPEPETHAAAGQHLGPERQWGQSNFPVLPAIGGLFPQIALTLFLSACVSATIAPGT